MSEESEELASPFGKAISFLRVALPTALALVFLFPIALSGLSGDDIPNSMRSANLQVNGWTPWEYVNLLISQWKTHEGRFFPIAILENVFIFDLIHSVFLYKLLQYFTTISLLVFAAVLITKIVGSKWLFPIALFVLVGCVQTRNWYDPTLGFGLLLQSVQIKTLACLYSLCRLFQTRENKWLWYLGSCVAFWVLALLQYEVVVTLFPTLVILIIYLPGDRLRKVTSFVTLLLSTVLYLGYVFRIRAGINASAAYTFNIDLSVASLTYIKQLSGGMPFSAVVWARGSSSFLTAMSELPLLHLLLLSATMALTIMCRSHLANVSRQRAVMLLAIGLNFVLGPTLTTAISVRWQNEVNWGLSYLSVAFVYTGVAFMALSILIMVSGFSITKPIVSTTLISLFVLLFGLSAISNHDLLDNNVSKTKILRKQRDLYELAIRRDFFADVPDSSIIIYPFFDENYWVNDYFTEWLGGPKKLSFVRTDTEAKTRCASRDLLKQCPNMFLLEYFDISPSLLALSLTHLGSSEINFQISQHFFGKGLDHSDWQKLCSRVDGDINSNNGKIQCLLN